MLLGLVPAHFRFRFNFLHVHKDIHKALGVGLFGLGFSLLSYSKYVVYELDTGYKYLACSL